MGAAYPQELRDRVFTAADAGTLSSEIATSLQVSLPWVNRTLQRRREHGETQPRPSGGATYRKIDMQQLAQLVEQHPDATLKELVEMLDCDCAISAVWHALERLGISFRKRQSMQQSRIAPMLPSDASNGVKTRTNSTLDA